MTLRLEHVVPELRAVVRGFAARASAFDAAIVRAEAALTSWATDPAAGDAHIQAAMGDDPRPFALSFGEPVSLRRAPPPRGALTVVAADGSSIPPDRFAPVPCYVINIGYVVLPYGTGVSPMLQAEATVGPRSLLVASEDDGSEAVEARGFGVDLLRDVLELERGHDLAAHATESGESVLLLDGTLLPWDLDARHVAQPIREEAVRRTDEALRRLRGLGQSLSIGAYVSATRAADVATSLSQLQPVTPPTPLSDAALFRRLLAEGERSALFRAQSRRGERVETLLAEHAVVFFYLRIGGEVARIEVPAWAASAVQVDRLHAALVDQCARCDGYPRALQEAHEQAVITAADRAAFARLLEREALAHGFAPASTGKAWSKRRRAV